MYSESIVNLYLQIFPEGWSISVELSIIDKIIKPKC